MITIFITFIALVIAYYIRKLYQLYTLRQQLTTFIKDVVHKTVLIKVENVEGTLFAYNLFNNAYIAQGKDIDELGVNFKLVHPNKVGLILNDQEQTVQHDFSRREKRQLDSI
jgi:hypothetical protein